MLTLLKRKMKSLLISHKVCFRAKNIIRDKEVHFLMIKRSFHQEDMFMHLLTVFQNTRGKDKTAKRTKATIILEDFHTPFSIKELGRKSVRHRTPEKLLVLVQDGEVGRC